MKLEVEKAWRRRRAREKKRQERIDLAPAQTLRPKDRSIRYDNMKSAMAEELLICLLMKDPALADQTGNLTEADFSVPLLGRVFAQLKSRHEQGLELSLGVLEGLTPEETSHLAGALQRNQGPAREEAARDCVTVIMDENRGTKDGSEESLLALRDRMKQRKGVKS